MNCIKKIPTIVVAISAFLLPVSIISANIVENTTISQDGQGNATGIWDVIDTNTQIRSIQVSTQAVGSGTWATPTVISNASLDSFAPMIAVNANGDAVAVWSIIDPEFGITSLGGAIYTSTTGIWSSQTILSSSSENINPTYDVNLNDNGNFCAVWNSNLNSGLTVARGVLGTISSGWGSSSDMSAEQ